MKSLPVRRSQFKTADFAAWLARNGAEIGKPTNMYEVIRYRAFHGESRRAETHIVYAKESGLLTYCGATKQHYTQFQAGAQLYPTAESNPFHVPKAVQRQRKADEDGPSKSDKRRARLLERDGDGCWFCGLPLGDDMTFEHLVPRSKGGRDALDNYALAHRSCNNSAADLPLVRKIELRAEMRAASVDTHPKGGDALAAPFMSGAVPAAERAGAQTLSQSPPPPSTKEP